MFGLSPRRRRALALLLVASLGLPGIGDIAAAAPWAPADDATTDAAEDVPAFPGVSGVDLAALGYEGEALDAEMLAELGEELPDDPAERVAEIADRLEIAPPLEEGLEEAKLLLEETLAELNPTVGRLRSAHEVAEARQEETAGRLDDARARRAARTGALSDHRQSMAEVAVAAYVRPPDADVLASVLGGVATTNEDLTAGVLFSAKADHDGLVQDELEVALAVAGERLVQAQAVAAQAVQRADSAAAALAEAEARRDAHRQALETVALAQLALGEQITALRTDLEETIESTWGEISELGGIDVTEVPVVSVEGIRVHAAVAARLQALLAAAHADGVPLGGWGYRSTEQQILLRQAHCGPTPEDIYLKPSSACSPPTARPGSSMHERGLAVDFHLAGRSISTRTSPGYQWLAANAAPFGFYNLPSEPWHWSVNAQ